MNDMTGVVLVYTVLAAAVGVACWVTKSGIPLWALILFPGFKGIGDNDEDKRPS